MMNSEESTAECSASGQENGAASLDPDRPHKKARFPWQIKGKHHLKPQSNEPPVSSDLTLENSETVTTTPKDEISRIDPLPKAGGFATKKENPKKPIKKMGYCPLTGGQTEIVSPMPLETVISIAETMLINSAIERAKLEPPSPYTARPSRQFKSVKAARRYRNEEMKCISHWQAAQTVKGCFDNTINRVLETWMHIPVPTEERFLALDMARIVDDNIHSNNDDEDDNVENEGILMAINAHGLQNMGVPARAPTNTLAATLASGAPICDDSDSSLSSDDYEIPSERGGLPWPLDKRMQSSEQAVHYESWRPVHESRNTNPTEPYQFPTSGEDNEYEFMNTAVIQAIKSKGLMAAGTDFG